MKTTLLIALIFIASVSIARAVETDKGLPKLLLLYQQSQEDTAEYSKINGGEIQAALRVF